MSHTLITGLDNGDGTFDMTLPQALISDKTAHSAMGSEVRNAAGVGNTFYVFHTASLPDAVKRNPGTLWSGAIVCSANPDTNNAAIEAMLANPPKVSPGPNGLQVAGAVVWDALNPPL